MQPASAAKGPARLWGRLIPATVSLAALVAVTVVDTVLGVVPIASFALTGFQTLFVVPWAISLMLARPPPPAAGTPRSRRIRTLVGHYTITLVFVALATGCMASKLYLLIVPLDAAAGLDAAYRTYGVAAVVVAALGRLSGGGSALPFLARVAQHPARLMALSFGIAALLGGFVLTTPLALRDATRASFVDGLFTAVSAVCVTGLAVNDVGRTYTYFGQGVLLALIQIGGLGIMVLSASFTVLAGRRLQVRSSAVLAEMIDADSIAGLRSMIRAIVLWTLAIELVGAALLYASYVHVAELAYDPAHPHPLAGPASPLWAAVFHSVSAFCNAGFSLWRTNLEPWAGSYGMNVTIAALIVAGGIGFPVLQELGRRTWRRLLRRRNERLSLHARVVLSTTGILIVSGAIGIAVLEWGGALGHLSWPERGLAAVFHSVSTRTAGFNTVPIGAMAPATLLLVMALMFIGGSPGSCAGGIKTSTFLVLVSIFRAERRGLPAPVVFGRELPGAVQRKALVVSFLSAVVVIAATFVLFALERHDPLHLAFEVVSAFGTVGLSAGVTAELGAPAKLLIALVMFVGRTGPLTLALAAADKAAATTYRLPEERVMIG